MFGTHVFFARTCFNEFLLLPNVAWVNRGLYCIVCRCDRQVQRVMYVSV